MSAHLLISERIGPSDGEIFPGVSIVIPASVPGICQPRQYVEHQGNGERDTTEGNDAIGEGLIVVHPTIFPLATLVLPVLTGEIEQRSKDEWARNRP